LQSIVAELAALVTGAAHRRAARLDTRDTTLHALADSATRDVTTGVRS
jgi:hypothetical protein